MEQSISQTIKDRIKNIKAGELFTISDFEDVDNDNLVTRTLSRIARWHNLRPVAFCNLLGNLV